ncbi:MAG TPA: AbrB/MazE/SpoVT family DNA-binding domain-containing protein [bacterium]|jgi:antitoxin PrlF|nr:AbrB/MazE/SpoVT family DNA-binding domain-containing protein [bacterium]
MRLTSKGQLTVPQDLRKKMGWTRTTELEALATKEGVLIKGKAGAPSRGQKLVQRLAGKADAGWTTDKLLALTRG